MKFDWIKPRRQISKVQSKPVDPASLPAPESAAEYVRRGMIFYARKQYEAAVEDFNRAIALDPRLVDGYYALGMVYKAMKKPSEAVAAFQNAITLLGAQGGERDSRREMLRRLALGHINEIQIGDWNLEKEIWKHNSR